MASKPRFFVKSLIGDLVNLDQSESHHLMTVLRLNIGDAVTLFDGTGNVKLARISHFDGKNAHLKIKGTLPCNESPIKITVALAVPRAQKMSFVIAKLTELGVATIKPLLVDHSAVTETYINSRINRWESIGVAAAKQCGRGVAPHISRAQTLEESLADTTTNNRLLMNPGARNLQANVKISTSVNTWIGPEGGWSKRELEIARTHSVITFGLGPRIFRIETAAICSVTILQWIAGDLNTS